MQISRFCAKSENFCAVARPHVLESLPTTYLPSLLLTLLPVLLILSHPNLSLLLILYLVMEWTQSYVKAAKTRKIRKKNMIVHFSLNHVNTQKSEVSFVRVGENCIFSFSPKEDNHFSKTYNTHCICQGMSYNDRNMLID